MKFIYRCNIYRGVDKCSSISSSHSIKTYWNMSINMVTSHTSTQNIFFHPHNLCAPLPPLEVSEIQDGAHCTATLLVCVGICSNTFVRMQCAFRQEFHMDPPLYKFILEWFNNFINKEECICNHRKRHSSQPLVSEQIVDNIRVSVITEKDIQANHWSQSKLLITSECTALMFAQ